VYRYRRTAICAIGETVTPSELISSLPNRLRKPFKQALAVAIAGYGVGARQRNRFKLGAVVCKGKHTLIARFNTYKTHPKLAELTQYPFLCAEANAILSLGMDRCNETSLYVARVDRNSQVSTAKPCDVCQALISASGISTVYYTTKDGVKGYEV